MMRTGKTLLEEDDISKAMYRFRRSLDSFTEALAKEIDAKKRDTLVTGTSEEAVHRSFGTVEAPNVKESE